MSGIPVLTAEGDCIARAWENAMLRLFESGCEIKTQYDKPGDPGSKDVTMSSDFRYNYSLDNLSPSEYPP